ncbi:MAG TPA: hypothetical protein VNO14_11115 [Blastocatellia bacterium]|nr:hypothetical protein [Blastocatellia bacterium]
MKVDGRTTGLEQFHSIPGQKGLTLKSTSEIRERGVVHKIVTETEYYDKRPARYKLEITTGGRSQKYTLEFAPLGVHVFIDLNGRTTQRTMALAGDLVLLDKNVWHHYWLMLARYDMNKSGKQWFRVFIPQAAFRQVNAVVEYKGLASIKVGDEKKQGHRFSINLANGYEINIIADKDGMPLSIEVPGEEIEVELQGHSVLKSE